MCVSPSCLPFPWLFDGSEFSARLLAPVRPTEQGFQLCVSAQGRFQVFLSHPQGLATEGPGAGSCVLSLGVVGELCGEGVSKRPLPSCGVGRIIAAFPAEVSAEVLGE